MKAIGGDRLASAMIDRVAAAAGANPRELQRLEAWSRLREAAQAPKEQKADEEPKEKADEEHPQRRHYFLHGAEVTEEAYNRVAVVFPYHPSRTASYVQLDLWGQAVKAQRTEEEAEEKSVKAEEQSAKAEEQSTKTEEQNMKAEITDTRLTGGSSSSTSAFVPTAPMQYLSGGVWRRRGER